ncbi:hypothetical protein TNCT_262031 [Trichonephila clavata]|uniref:Uncharacterized protein n=1 Tax=Trichonephila clavata TaxID=2740835 RepID=A0A8X6GD16_TRICU|nr:hypothetical protein TNCT_262031 [Trichonephila clavata]
MCLPLCPYLDTPHTEHEPIPSLWERDQALRKTDPKVNSRASTTLNHSSRFSPRRLHSQEGVETVTEQ